LAGPTPCHFHGNSLKLSTPRAGRGHLIVDIGPPPRWHTSVHLCHSVPGCPGRPHLGPDPMMLQRLAEPAAAPGGRVGGAEKWHRVAGFGAFFEHPYTGVPSPHSALIARHSARIGLSSTIVPASVRPSSDGKADRRPSSPSSLYDIRAERRRRRSPDPDRGLVMPSTYDNAGGAMASGSGGSEAGSQSRRGTPAPWAAEALIVKPSGPAGWCFAPHGPGR
jgi:hypothetical protein